MNEPVPSLSQLIFSPRCTEAEGWRWHKNHFCCQDCAGPLGGDVMLGGGAAPAAPLALRVATRMPAGAWPRPWKAGRRWVREERCRSKGKWAEGVPPGWGPRPGPTPSRPSSSAPVLQPHPQTRASGPAALTTHPWPERSEGLPSPSRAAGEAAARDWLPDWGCCRPPVGGGGAGRGEEPEGPSAAACAPPGRGGRRGPATGWEGAPRPDLGCDAQASEEGLSDPAEQGRRGSAEPKEGTALRCPPRPPAPAQKPRGGCWGPAGSRRAQLGTRRRRPEDGGRAPWRRPLVPRRTSAAPPAPLPPAQNPKAFS